MVIKISETLHVELSVDCEFVFFLIMRFVLQSVFILFIFISHLYRNKANNNKFRVFFPFFVDNISDIITEYDTIPWWHLFIICIVYLEVIIISLVSITCRPNCFQNHFIIIPVDHAKEKVNINEKIYCRCNEKKS